MYSSRNRPRSCSEMTGGGPPCQQVGRVRQNPRVAQDAPTDKHALDAAPEFLDDLLRRHAVAAAEDRNAQAVGHLGHAAPVRLPGVALRRGAAVHRDRAGTDVFHHLRNRGRIAVRVVPARAHLDGHRDLHRPGHGENDCRPVLGLLHEAAARVVLCDLRDRTAHADVHDVGAHGLDDSRRLGHRVRIAAKDLVGHGTLLDRVLRVLERVVDTADEPPGADHLSDHQAAAPLALHETAKRRVDNAQPWGR